MLEKKGFKIAIGILAGLVVGAITVIAAIYILILVIFFGGPPKVTKGIEKYEQTMKENTTREYGKARTEFLTFPKKVPESAFEQESKPVFYNSFQDTWDDPTYEVYLKCQYSDEDYQAEIERLKSVEKTYSEYDGRKQSLLYDDSDRFKYPAYIAIDHHDNAYEYALDLGDDSIAYIYTAYKNSEKNLKKIPREYLPSDYDESLSGDNAFYFNIWDENTTCYNIYMQPKYEGHSVTHGLSAYDIEELDKALPIGGLVLFPNDTSKLIDGSFDYRRDDDFGYVFLEANYSAEDYKAEEARFTDEDQCYATYDASTYQYPAYVVFNGEQDERYDNTDGVCYEKYEYALMDEANNRIIYVFLLNPSMHKLQQYDEYLAVNKSIY